MTTPARVARLHALANAGRWSLSVESFGAALESSVAHAFAGKSPSDGDVDRYLDSLNLEDLALAVACGAGDERAWEHFVLEHRPVLYRAAAAIDPTGGARDLADSLYADLFGLRERDGERQSLFRYFHGRSSLATWLRAVLAQRHVDRLRAARKLEPLPDDESSRAVVATTSEADPERPRFLAVLATVFPKAVAALAPRDRLRLGCYYGQNLKLAQIGRLLDEHEATVSRHLTRTRREIRDFVARVLREEHRMDEAAIDRCFECVVSDPGSLNVAGMLGMDTGRKIVADDRSTG